MNILGLSCYYHDSAAALVQDGQLIAAVEEERFNRKKHYFGFPDLAIEYCLKEAGITANDLDIIAFYEKPLKKFARLMTNFVATWPKSYSAFRQALPVWLHEKLWIRRNILKSLGVKKPILFGEHHLSHAASAFLVSPFEEAAILTLDGVGEWSTTAIGYGKGTDITLENEIRFPHSLGLLYSTITAYLGFKVNDAEWKVMGLAPYGKPTYLDKFEELITTKPDGSFRLNLDYFAYHYHASLPFNKKFEQHFGRPRRTPSDDHPEEFYRDIAHSGQKATENAIVNMAQAAYDRYGLDKLCIAGGVGLNSVANWRIMQKTPFKDIFIQPAAGDDGAAIGVAFHIYNTVMGKPRTYVMDNAYLGPSFTGEEIEDFLKSRGVQYDAYDKEGMLERTAREIAANKVIGWFQGRMEFGPRALGGRSILANPMNPEMKDIINAKIKFREKFRPFAPSVLKERANEYFDLGDVDSPYMLLIPDVKKDKRAVIPAVTHQDGTGRVQTVTKEANGIYYDLISMVDKITGCPVVLNTSFNVRGEPIVCTPEDAYNCFMKTGIDILVMGNYVIETKDEATLTEDVRAADYEMMEMMSSE
ncbi:MAG: carbamoyltransferase [Planctomycetota bacterium]|nr:carbamoyltransferase [Planctomycetota bacterium]